MQITSRFTIATQIMLTIACFSDKYKLTSEFIAKTTNANPVIIRRITSQLKEAKLIEVKAGVGGASITKDLKDITLYDIFQAVGAVEDNFFSFHENPNCVCPVGKNIHNILDGHLLQIQMAMNNQMKKTNLEDLLQETKPFII